MSYILDALKKAERDRLRDDPQRLDDFTSAAWDPYQPIKTKKSASKAMVVLVIIVTCLLFAFYSTGGFRLFHSQDKTTDDLSLDLSIDKQKTTEKIQVEAERSSEPPVEIEVEANQVVLEPDFVIKSGLDVETLGYAAVGLALEVVFQVLHVGLPHANVVVLLAL